MKGRRQFGIARESSRCSCTKANWIQMLHCKTPRFSDVYLGSFFFMTDRRFKDSIHHVIYLCNGISSWLFAGVGCDWDTEVSHFCKVWCEGVWVWGAWKQGAWKQGSAKWVRDSSLQQHHWSQHHPASPGHTPLVESEVWSQLGVTSSNMRILTFVMLCTYVLRQVCIQQLFFRAMNKSGSPEVCSARSYTNGREWDVWHWPEDYFLLPQHWTQLFCTERRLPDPSVDMGNI